MCWSAHACASARVHKCVCACAFVYVCARASARACEGLCDLTQNLKSNALYFAPSLQERHAARQCSINFHKLPTIVPDLPQKNQHQLTPNEDLSPQWCPPGLHLARPTTLPSGFPSLVTDFDRILDVKKDAGFS